MVSTAAPHPILSDELVECVADRFRALSDPTRIKLVQRLHGGEATVTELTEAVGATQQNVSKHLALLLRTGVVARRRQGNFAYYRIVDPSILTLCDLVCRSLVIDLERRRRAITGQGGL